MALFCYVPQFQELIKWLKICEDYAQELNILFNGAKSKYLVFGDYKYIPILKVNNEIVTRCNSAMHLGHLLQAENTHDALVEHAINGLNGSFHNFMSRFGSCNITSRNKLFHQYCSSVYGSRLATNKNVEKVCTRVYHRRALRLVNTVHCDLFATYCRE